jgi:UDP-N-acetylmuramoyl-tripeptide--D-alanyl-D-alanine ligase
VARAAGARLLRAPALAPSAPGPRGATVDSRGFSPGDLFVGLRGERADGGAYATQALAAGAWGVLVTPQRARSIAERAAREPGADGVVLAHPDPLRGLQALALAWRRELGAGGTKVVAITGSTGKTSTKDILAAILAGGSRAGDAAAPAGGHAPALNGRRAIGLRTVASPQNFNTEIGLPLAVLAAPSDTEVLVLELGMRGPGQIAELTSIAEPDVGVVVNIGPAHLELLGSLQAIAAAKAELIAGLPPGATVVIPADEPLLAPHLRSDLRTVTFGHGGDVALEDVRPGRAVHGDSPGGAAASQSGSARSEVFIRERRRGATGAGTGEGTGRIVLEPSFGQAHNLRNLLAAVAVARALGVTPERALEVRFSALRGQRLALEGGIVLIDDCYNANPMSMCAAIDDLAETAPARRVAVLGDMLELGPGAPRFHHEIGEHAAARGVELLVAVGPLAAEMREGFAGEVHCVPDAEAAVELLCSLLREGDTVLVKGSRAVGLERVAEALGTRSARARRRAHARDATVGAPSARPRRR